MSDFDIVALLKYMNEQKKPKRWRREKEANPFDALQDIQDNAARWEKFTKDLAKINKKDDKEGWEALSFMQKFTIMTAVVPIVVALEFLMPIIIIVKILGLHQ